MTDNPGYPVLLDLFCGAGGAAMGYHRAGWRVIGVDYEPQPRYPFSFYQMDWAEALEALGPQVGAIHASPPCQGYSAMNRAVRAEHPLLITDVREALVATGLPWVIENVEGARRDMRAPVCLCGTMFGLRVRRHRLFESPVSIRPPAGCDCRDGVVEGRLIGARRGGRPSAGRRRPPAHTESEHRTALGVEWMTCKESRQAIPPAYTQWVGAHLLIQWAKSQYAA